MPRRQHAVLIRGINLGARNKVPMPALRDALTGAGFESVQTLLQSGNVVVSSSLNAGRVASAVEHVLATRFAISAPCIAISTAELRAAVDGCPLLHVADDFKRLVAIFTSRPISRADCAAWDPTVPDEISVGHRVVYQWCPQDFRSAPNLLPRIEKRWQLTGTARNWSTTTKLLAMVQSDT